MTPTVNNNRCTDWVIDNLMSDKSNKNNNDAIFFFRCLAGITALPYAALLDSLTQPRKFAAKSIATNGEHSSISLGETAEHLLEKQAQEHEENLNQLQIELSVIHEKLQEPDADTGHITGVIYGLIEKINVLRQVKVLQKEASTSACSSSSSIPVVPPFPEEIPPPPGGIPPPPPPPPPVETASQKIAKLLVVFNKLAKNLTQDESIFNEVIAKLTEIKISNRQEAIEKESFFNRYKEIILSIKDQKINEKIDEISRLQGEQSQASVDRRYFHSRATALEQEKKQANYQSFQALNKELKSLRVSLESNEKSLASYADGLDKLRNASRITSDGVECMQAKNNDEGLVIIPLDIYSRKLKEIEEEVIHCRNQCATLAPKIPSIEEKLAAYLSQNPHFQNLEEEIMACKGQATYCSNRALDLVEQIKKEERNLNRLRIERNNFSKKTINVSIVTASTSAEAEPSTPRPMDLASQLKSRKANLSKKTEIKVDDEMPHDDGETSKPKIDLSTISSSRGSLRRIPKEVKASTSTSDLLAMLGSSR